jgi:Ankyrin repeats (many copies)
MRFSYLNLDKGNADRAIEVIERGCKLDISYFDGCNPLIKSSNYGYTRIVECLLMNGVDVNRRSRNGNTALMKGKSHMIYICNFHVLYHLLLIYICKLHWNP